MCLNPILRPNTSFRTRSHFSFVGKDKHVHHLEQYNKLQERIANTAKAFGKDDENSYIYVPCGHCSECIAARQNNIVQRVEVESRTHHLFFATLTYDNAHLPKVKVSIPAERFDTEDIPDSETLFSSTDPDQELSDSCINVMDRQVAEIEDRLSLAVDDFSEGTDFNSLLEEESAPIHDSIVIDGDTLDSNYKEIEIPFADIHDVQLLLKNLRDNLPKDKAFGNRDLKYLAVSELGKTNGRPHFHILFMVEKLPCDIGSDGRTVQLYSLESALRKAVFKYWAHNVGTRKQPVYEQLFTYRRRFYGQKVYTNFDLHWVDPSRTKSGTQNVAYYVTKYLLKGSEQEKRRQQFLRLNIKDDNEYADVWNVVKCRCLLSKGVGVNGRCITVRTPQYSHVSLVDYAKALDALYDLPDENEDIPQEFCPTVVGYSRRRIMRPDPAVLADLHQNVLADIGKKPGPVYIDSQGKHRPLGRYFQRFPEIYGIQDFYDLYFAYDDRYDVPSYEKSKEWKDQKEQEFASRIAVAERNSSFDTSPALLWGSDFVDNNSYHISF